MDVAIQSVVGVAMVPEAILEKLEPMAPAMVVASILRLWVLNRDGSIPAFASKELKWFWKVHLVRKGAIVEHEQWLSCSMVL